MGDNCEVKEFNLTERTGESSFRLPIEAAILERRPVKIETLDRSLQLIPKNRFKNIHYLKTDCQGWDYLVLKGAEKSLKSIAIITCEINNQNYFYEENQRKLITTLLENNDFYQYNSPLIKTPSARKYIIDKHSKMLDRIKIIQKVLRLQQEKSYQFRALLLQIQPLSTICKK